MLMERPHAGDITGALGTIRHGDVAPRASWRDRILTLLAIVGPGLIVMVGDNDAGAFGTYTLAAQNYGTRLLWTLLLLVPVLFVNQEMVLRLGAVTGVGHARLILARFGTFWGAFSVIDLFALNALTLVTEFIGITLALDYFGIPTPAGVALAAVLVTLAAATGSFRRFERFAMMLCIGSLLLLPVLLAVHAPLGPSLHDLVVPGLPRGADVSAVMLIVVAIVGTTIAPWQLFFQQSYVIDKRITPRFIGYERWDLAIGIVFVLVGAFALMSLTAGTFAGRPEFGRFTDAGAVAAGIAKYAGSLPAALFTIALIDASMIGAAAVSLATAYALADVLQFRHSLHRGIAAAPAFYAMYGGLIAVAAALVLIPGVPLGLLTNAVQALAGVLLPSATVFLLLLSNDRAILGPWANTRRTNAFTSMVIAALVVLSVVLTVSIVLPSMTTAQMLAILAAGAVLTVAAGALVALTAPGTSGPAPSRTERERWRMPPLEALPPATVTPLDRIWLIVLRAYLVVAVVLVVIRVAQLALHRG